MAEPENRPGEPIRIDADKARGAELILKKRLGRVIFFAGLVGFVLLALSGAVIARAIRKEERRTRRRSERN